MKIKVSNLPYSTSWFELHDLFNGFGDIVSLRIQNYYQHKSVAKIAIIEMRNTECAFEAIEGLNGDYFKGNILILDIYENQGKEELLTFLRRRVQGFFGSKTNRYLA
ncbi:MAG: RNA-binding protein [Bacteroidia bacterium]|nr:RNA-binding protein [Bacteroidia bacterium]